MTIFGVLESTRRYEHTGAIIRQFWANFDRTQDSTVAGLTGLEAVDGLQGVETVFGCDWIWWSTVCYSLMGARTLSEVSERKRQRKETVIVGGRKEEKNVTEWRKEKYRIVFRRQESLHRRWKQRRLTKSKLWYKLKNRKEKKILYWDIIFVYKRSLYIGIEKIWIRK